MANSRVTANSQVTASQGTASKDTANNKADMAEHLKRETTMASNNNREKAVIITISSSKVGLKEATKQIRATASNKVAQLMDKANMANRINRRVTASKVMAASSPNMTHKVNKSKATAVPKAVLEALKMASAAS